MAYNRFLGQNGFRGVDFTSHPSLVKPDRLADAVNVWRDYKSGQGSAIETFPGYRRIFKYNRTCSVCNKVEPQCTCESPKYIESKVNGLFRFRVSGVNYILAHIGTSLFYFKEGDISKWDISKGVTLTEITVTLSDAKSSGFQFGDRFYLIDGANYICVSATVSGEVTTFTAEKAEDKAYTPTTFINGTEHEQRNMLVDKEIQEYMFSVYGAMAVTEFEFERVPGDRNAGDCYVKKCLSTTDTIVVVPQKAKIGDQEYTVTEIGDGAFLGIKNIKTVILPYTVTTIGYRAFYECTALQEVFFLTGGLRIISSHAFANCYSLASVYTRQSTVVGQGLSVQSNAFLNAGKDLSTDGSGKTQLVLCGDSQDIDELKENVYGEGISDVEITVSSTYDNPTSSYRIPIYSPCEGIEEVKIGDSKIYIKPDSPLGIPGIYYTEEKQGDLITAVIVDGRNAAEYIGQTVKITLKSSPSEFATSNYTPFLSSQSGYTGSALGAVLECTICAQFDGRVFFTGNPNLPNTVFYTHRDNTGHNNPFYIGTYNYFNTGIGQSPNTAMIAAGSNLIVFKSDTIQDGSINLYQGVDGTDDILPRIYVRQQGLAGVGCLGSACNFADDPVFISKRGLDAVGTQTVNLERTIQHRSSNVDRKLTAEDLANAQMTEWEGYLVVLVPGGRIYLADSRQLFNNSAGYVEYEWYFLDDIGSYVGDRKAHAFSSVLPVQKKEDGSLVTVEKIDGKDLSLHDSPDTLVSGEVISCGSEDNEICYVDIGDYRYPVYHTGEMIGGTFYPASCIVGFDEYLLFGTTNGDICVFNTDKRGTMPSDADFMGITEDDYKAKYADIIPREYFTHMGHRYLSAIYLAQENAGVPHMVKNTVKRSAVLKAKDIFGSVFKWNVKTDRQPFGEVAEIATAMPDLSSAEFGAFLFDTSYDGSIIAINERRKRYVEKQYAFFSDDYCRPFGIYHISYQYEIQGRVKNR